MRQGRRALIASMALGLALPLSAAASERGLTIADDPTPGVHLTLRVNALVGGVTRPLAPGERLRSGDRIELQVEVDRPAWLYVLQAFPDGTSAVLFPASGELQVAPNTTTRLPDPGKWFQLDDHPGTEHVVVVASAAPLSRVDQAARKVIDDIRRPRPTKKKPRPTTTTPTATTPNTPVTPTALSLKTRGLMVVNDDHSIRAESDAAGVALFRFSFEHTP